MRSVARRRFVALAAVGCARVAAVGPAAAVVLGRLGWLDRPWQGAADTAPRGHAHRSLGDARACSWGAEIPLLLACVAAALIVADRLHGFRPIALAAVPLAALAASTLPVAQDVTLEVGVGLDLAVAAALVLPGAWLLRRGQAAWGAVAAATGLAVLGLCRRLVSGAAGHRRWPRWPPRPCCSPSVRSWSATEPPSAPLRLGLGIAATLSAVGEAAAFARAEGAGWPAVWSLALGLCALAAGAGARSCSPAPCAAGW